MLNLGLFFNGVTGNTGSMTTSMQSKHTQINEILPVMYVEKGIAVKGSV